MKEQNIKLVVPKTHEELVRLADTKFCEMVTLAPNEYLDDRYQLNRFRIESKERMEETQTFEEVRETFNACVQRIINSYGKEKNIEGKIDEIRCEYINLVNSCEQTIEGAKQRIDKMMSDAIVKLEEDKKLSRNENENTEKQQAKSKKERSYDESPFI